jgi:environmental stress-induced protein Ves
MKFQHIQSIVSNWSGGSTSQLYIYPANASLQEMNFDLRISSAAIEVESSNFTKFPGYQRVIFPLEGILMLQHDQNKAYQLQPFELATFNGESDTTGQGKVIDFNIIFKPSISPQVTIIKLNNQEEYQFELMKGLVYCVNGRVEIAGEIVREKNAYFGTDIHQIVKTEQCSLLIVVTW